MPVVLINPNSNEAVTDGMREAVAPLAAPDGPALECVTLTSGPFGIEAQADIEAVTLPLRDMVAVRDDAAAFVIACFSDPGLAVCREAVAQPVYGIRECAVMTALMHADRFGLIAMSSRSVKRHLTAFRALGVASRYVGARPLNKSVAEGAEADAFGKLAETGEALVQDGADALVMGCAGLARHRAALEAHCGVTVIDPVQAAASAAIGRVRLTAGDRA